MGVFREKHRCVVAAINHAHVCTYTRVVLYAETTCREEKKKKKKKKRTRLRKSLSSTRARGARRIELITRSVHRLINYLMHFARIRHDPIVSAYAENVTPTCTDRVSLKVKRGTIFWQSNFRAIPPLARRFRENYTRDWKVRRNEIRSVFNRDTRQPCFFFACTTDGVVRNSKRIQIRVVYLRLVIGIILARPELEELIGKLVTEYPRLQSNHVFLFFLSLRCNNPFFFLLLDPRT